MKTTMARLPQVTDQQNCSLLERHFQAAQERYALIRTTGARLNSSNSIVCTGVTRTGIHRIGLLGLNVSCHRYLQAWTQNATILLIQHMHRSIAAMQPAHWKHCLSLLAKALPSLISFEPIKLMQLQVEHPDGFQHIQVQVQSCCIINPSYRRTHYSKYPISWSS